MGRYFTTAAVAVCGVAVFFLAASAVEQWVPGTRQTLETQVFTPPTGRVKVDVRNAGGVAGTARAATERLRGIGYDVVDFGNAASFDLAVSVVIDRVGDIETAAAVAQVLGIARVHSELDPNLFVDVTVRLGADWVAPASGDGGGPRTALGWLRAVLGKQ